ncbi:capsular biosynthesis protein [Erythrobacter sp. KY5]|uniref:capsule biosynthesis protein n=1 Tax=Erythrobacter sp. KY5 TaxID=2011159 RepID=UPI000DBF30A1|nr:capsular biosynthesis protein [Erythrobacter sp. KY5]AWW73662.1 capsular biosynthesis protein [Erythrobacter sp. KY5]
MFSHNIEDFEAKQDNAKRALANGAAPSELGRAVVPSPENPRTVLLLQGLMGPLFRRLGQELIRSGHKVYKVNFNGGDRLFWRLPGGIDYRESMENWPQALRRIIQEREITDVVLFGDCRSHHMAATKVCRELNVPVHVFEEGYVRPDWVTLELDGVNGHSRLPRDPEWYRKTAASLPAVPEHKQVPSSFRRRALEGLVYNFADVLTRWHYPHWSNHRPWHPLIEGIGWVRKLARGKGRRQRSAAVVERLLGSDTPYFLFPLQLASDAQIRLHSPFASMTDAVMMVLRSFAQNAPEGTRLLVKEHPLDNGVVDWRQEVWSMATLLGIADRVDYMSFGDIVPVAERAKGVVVINSTSGTLALDMDVPVIALGQAIYDIPDITFQNGLDRFWTEATPPDRATFDAFRRVLIERCLIPGGFFSEEALDKVVRHAVARFEGKGLLPE